LFAATLFVGCEDEDKNPFPAAELEAAAVLRTLSVTNPANINKNDIANSGIEITVEADDFGLDTFESVDVFVSFVDSFVDTDGETDTTLDDEDISKTDMLVMNIPASEFTEGTDGKPVTTININGQDALNLLGLEPDLERIDGGDIIRTRLAMNLSDGDVYTSTNVNVNVTGQFFNSPFRYDATIVCVLDSPPAGEYVVQMQDSYGDGWQTSNTSGGPGLTITLSNGEEIQVGLCSPYEVPAYDCTLELSAGSATVTIPEGLTSADWFFPGDAFGEISFQIFAPSGNQIASVTPGTAAGLVPLNLCNE
jgi:hypothetical protein